MKRIVSLILIFLMFPAAALAEALPLSDMTTEQLLELKNRIDEELLDAHAVPEDAEDRLRALIEPVLTEAGWTLASEWTDCAVVCEWGLSVMTASCVMQSGIVSRPTDIRVEAFLSENGDQLIYLCVGSDILADSRADLSDPRLLVFLGLAALSASDEAAASDANDETVTYVLNTNTRKFHDPSCKSVPDILPNNRLDTTASRDELISSGYAPCGRCNP